MESLNLQVVSAAKIHILNPNEFNLWKMRIEQYFLMTDYSLWKRTHTLIWRNKTDLEEQSLDDLFNSLKIYEAKVKSSSSASTSTQNIAFVSSQNTDSTNESVSAVASAKIPVSALPNVDTLTMTRVFRQKKNRPTMPSWHSPLDNALVVLRQKFKKAEQERDELKLKLEKFQTSSKNLSQLLASQTNDKTGLGYDSQVFNSSVFNCNAMFCFESDDSLPASPIYDRPRPAKTVVTKPYLPPRRTINRRPSPPASNFPPKVTTVQTSKINVVKGVQGNWVWKPKCPILNHVSYHTSASITLKGQSTACFEGQMSYRQWMLKELKFNLFSVSQMCNKKNNVLSTDTECIVLSPEFKLPDENQVLLRVHKENNMYNVDLKNIVPSGDLTCLFAKVTLDESNLWHRRLGHINFTAMNTLVKDPPNADGDATFKVKEPKFEGRKRDSAKTKKHDDKTKRDAKGKSLVEFSIRYRNLSEEFEDFSCYNSLTLYHSIEIRIRNKEIRRIDEFLERERSHATVHDGRITTEPVQRRALGNVVTAGTCGNQAYGNVTNRNGKKVICYNCRGDGHVARQCKEKKREKDLQYFEDKVLLMKAKERGKVLDAEAEAFLADVECDEPYDEPLAITTTTAFNVDHEN
nr:ribonuclease H-like domain-containing protein [Tanacetum cinerariifolium]